jgi:hypothetical protein
MKKHGPLLETHTGRRLLREHDDQVATFHSNCRRALYLPSPPRPGSPRDDPRHDGFSAPRSALRRATPRTRWECLSNTTDRSSPPTRPSRSPWRSTSPPCFTPVESPESHGMAEVLVNTCKRTTSGSALSRMPPPSRPLTMDGGLRHRASSSLVRIPLAREVHPFPNRCVSGLTGSTPRT